MSIQQALIAAMLLGASVAPALATAPMHAANGDAGVVAHGAEYSRINGQWQRVDTWNGLGAAAPDRRAYRQGDTSADGNYVYVGGEKGWELRSHGYKWQNGSLVHADALRHDTPKPSLTMTQQERDRQVELYRN